MLRIKTHAQRSFQSAAAQNARVALAAIALSGASVACGPLGDADDAGVAERDRVPTVEDGLPPASTFSCPASLEAGVECLDFNDGRAPGLLAQGGSYKVLGGRLEGRGTLDPAPACPPDMLIPAVIEGTSSRNVRVRAQLASIDRVDKAIILRAADPENRVQVNFRARDADGLFGDVMVQEIRGCASSIFTADSELPLEHDLGQAIDVVAQIVDGVITVHVDGVLIVERSFPVADSSGLAGVAVIDNARTLFDDLVVESLD